LRPWIVTVTISSCGRFARKLMMFTGLVETVGNVRRTARDGPGGRLEIAVTWPRHDPPSRGDSVAVDGACLTVVDPTDVGFAADLSPETLDRTMLGRLQNGDRVNLERALRFGDRIGGHLVQGHIDGITRVLSIRAEGSFSRWRLSLPRELAREIAVKGSVAVQGISLTVAALGSDWFEVALIPETLRATTLGGFRVGAEFHIETDVLAKYVARGLDGTERSAIEKLFGGERD
jgi:riboflavin synthase